ncbi:S-layer homology domain-containing protein [Planococcus shenhongbingii]|uniref:S-layer homology domain-containing protein n=1 Tax=Planococcus shenhongbingii TaxID=3058398 RepID=A0ABT8N9N5_9BACL|nr:S-layer homology domain-containing protein [Planococcus sp. N017]MDN7244603.1 S-layer homology domain-containing protein [Planococcus sp. N017]
MKKLLSPIAIVLSLLLAVPAAGAPSDLPEQHPYYDEINYLMEKGILTGYSDGTVRPDTKVTRAEVALMIGRLKEFDGTKRTTGFRDVPAEHFASGYIVDVVKAGYISGYPDGTYRPGEPINRRETAITIDRVFDLNFIFHFEYRDVPDGVYYYDAVHRLAAASISIGYPDNTFRPELEVSRGEFSAMLARALEPKFKNDAAIEHSYQRDKTKTYTYRQEDGRIAVDRFVLVPPIDGKEDEFIWETRIGEEVYSELEYENYESFAIGYPYSEYGVQLVYPIQVGKEFVYGYALEPIIYTITGVNKTVETEYKTFTNAVEVTTHEGGKYYMVEGFAVVKWIKGDGTIYTELLDVK